MVDVCATPDLSFGTVLAKFETFHRDPVSVALHILTTPIIFLGYLSLACKGLGSVPVLSVAALYFFTLPFQMDGAADGVLPATLAIMAVEVVAALLFARRLGWLPLLMTTAVGALGQVFAHRVTGERAYMDAYVAECRQGVVARASALFLEQAYFQLPLVLSVSRPLWWLAAAAVPTLAVLVSVGGPKYKTD